MRWSDVKIDLNELARLRWIEKMSVPEICKKLGWARSTIQVSIRTIRNCGLSQLNLEDFEKNEIKKAIINEIEKMASEQPRFHLNTIASEFLTEAT